MQVLVSSRVPSLRQSVERSPLPRNDRELNDSTPNISRIVNAIQRPSSLSYSNVVAVEESSLEEEMQTTPTGYFSPKYSIIEKGSRKNTDLLLDGQGFCYTVKCSFPNSRTWMCSTNRNGLNPCRGTVSQRDEHFLIKKSHNHPPNNHLEDNIKLRNEKKKSPKNVRFWGLNQN